MCCRTSTTAVCRLDQVTAHNDDMSGEKDKDKQEDSSQKPGRNSAGNGNDDLSGEKDKERQEDSSQKPARNLVGDRIRALQEQLQVCQRLMGNNRFLTLRQSSTSSPSSSANPSPAAGSRPSSIRERGKSLGISFPPGGSGANTGSRPSSMRVEPSATLSPAASVAKSVSERPPATTLSKKVSYHIKLPQVSYPRIIQQDATSSKVKFAPEGENKIETENKEEAKQKSKQEKEQTDNEVDEAPKELSFAQKRMALQGLPGMMGGSPVASPLRQARRPSTEAAIGGGVEKGGDSELSKVKAQLPNKLRSKTIGGEGPSEASSTMSFAERKTKVQSMLPLGSLPGAGAGRPGAMPFGVISESELKERLSANKKASEESEESSPVASAGMLSHKTTMRPRARRVTRASRVSSVRLSARIQQEASVESNATAGIGQTKENEKNDEKKEVDKKGDEKNEEKTKEERREKEEKERRKEEENKEGEKTEERSGDEGKKEED